MPLKGNGTGNLNERGALNFSFSDELGRHGIGIFLRKGAQYMLTLKTSDQAKGISPHVEDQFSQVYNQTFSFRKR